jgi:O-6-methylguanine DNA methyltransferase
MVSSPASAAAPGALRYASYPSPIGRLSVAFDGPTAFYADLDVSDEAFEDGCEQRRGVRPIPGEAPPRLRSAVADFFEGSGRYRGPVDLSVMTDLQQRALRKALEIRRGEVRTYSWIAAEIGVPQAPRAVGTAMARNPIPILVPCHRVIRGDFIPRTYGCGGPSKKAAILTQEGVDLARLQRLAAAGHAFEGNRTTLVFCLPGCHTGRNSKPEHHVGFPSVQAAQAAGYQPCKACCPA